MEVFFVAHFKRKEGESFEAFLRRFNRGLKNSKKLNVAREKKYLEPQKNKRKQKQEALIRLRKKHENEYLRKIGKLPEENK